MFTPNPGEMIQLDEHIFQVGWFNHQPVIFPPQTKIQTPMPSINDQFRDVSVIRTDLRIEFQGQVGGVSRIQALLNIYFPWSQQKGYTLVS